MAGGTILRKKIVDGPQGTGDNYLLIDRNYLYQVPFTFGDDWNEIIVGGFLSLVNHSDITKGRAVDTYSCGNSSPDTINWIGLTKNAQTKTLPTQSANQGFVGHRSNRIEISSSDTFNIVNKLEDSDTVAGSQGAATLCTTYGETMLASGQVLGDDALSSSANGGNIMAVCRLSTSPGNPSSSGEFCGYFGMKFTVNNKGQPNQSIKVQMATTGDNNYQSSCVSDVSSEALKNLLDGAHDLASPTTAAYTGLAYNDGVKAYDLPDSFMYYNAFPQFKARIHNWAVKKIS